MFFKPIYILILFFTIIIDYFAGIWLDKTSDPVKKKRYLIISLIANIGVLAIFKYFNFINENISTLTYFLGCNNPIPYLSILLPIGLSFHTFQAMSYTIEVYRGNQKAEHHFGIYALYVMFYPQLVAGPIERPQNILHQFYEKHSFDFKNVVTGLCYIAFGLFTKIVIADRLSPYVNEVFGDVSNQSSITLLVAVFFFSIQIYCDFSGYSNIAIGCARVMGFDLMRNFNSPYFSKNITEFWSRWHISLSTWFRDYLYIPLGGNRVSKFMWYRNLTIVFLVSGLWHGASWNFIIWGGLHAFYIVFGIITNHFRQSLINKIGLNQFPRINLSLSVLTTFVLVSFAWIFFRAKNLADARMVIRRIFEFKLPFSLSEIALSFGVMNLLISIILIILFSFSYKLPSGMKFKNPMLFCAVMFILILIFGSSGTGEFIYFQF